LRAPHIAWLDQDFEALRRHSPGWFVFAQPDPAFLEPAFESIVEKDLCLAGCTAVPLLLAEAGAWPGADSGVNAAAQKRIGIRVRFMFGGFL